MARRQEPARAVGPGRAELLGQVREACAAAAQGRGSIRAVTGPVGIGKTWFCRRAMEVASNLGFWVGWGAAWPDTEPAVLWPWREALAGRSDTTVARLAAEWEVLTNRDRADRYLDVVNDLRDATAAAPGLIVIDDAHRSDPPTLHLAQVLARHLDGARLVVLVAHGRAQDARMQGLLSGLAGLAEVISLGGLSRSEVASLVATETGYPLDDVGIDLLTAVTLGNPRELHAVATSGDPVRALVEVRLADLDPHERDLLARVAVLEGELSLAEATTIGGRDPDETSTALAALERQRLLHRPAPDSIAFAHPEVQEALTATLPAATLLAAHDRAASLGAGQPSTGRLAQQAAHALAAAGLSADHAHRAAAVADRAARALAGAGDHRQAIQVLEAAMTAHERSGLGEVPSGMLVSLAMCVSVTGDLARARDLFERAAQRADTEQDAINRAVAAIGLGGVWLSEMREPIEHERALALQRRALAGLPRDAADLRCRLEARLVAEDAYARCEPALMDAVVERARALDEPAALAETLSLYHHTLLGPEHEAVRLPIAEDITRAADLANHELLSLMGRCWITVDLFLGGHDHAERALRSLRARTDATGCRSVGFIVEVMEVMLLIRSGDLAEAERRAADAFKTGTAVGDADALAYFGAQLVIIRWMQGRSAEMLATVAETAASPTLTPANYAFTAIHAALAADSGDLDAARSSLARLRATGLSSLPSSSAWMATLFAIIEGAHRLGDSATAREAGALLEPYADLPVLGSLGVVCLGSARRSVGLVAATLGHHDSAIDHLRRALTANERLGNRPMATMTRVDLAEVLLERARPEDRRLAVKLLNQAIGEASSMNLSERVERWRQLAASAEELDRATRRAGLGNAVGLIQRQGGSWIIRAADHQVIAPDLVGMAYLARLLTNPGRDIPAGELMAGQVPADGWTPDQPVLDDQALASYRGRVIDLEQEISEADRFGDGERAALARIELDVLLEELTRSTNAYGRARAFTSSPERARTAVRKALRRALDEVEAHDSRLGGILRASIRTGRSCCYQPGPDAPSRWLDRTT